MKSSVRFKCSYEGCNEYANYEADNRSHAVDLQKRYGNGVWKCSRHSQPGEVLSAEAPVKTKTLKVFQETYGRFWGTDRAITGFTFGPGFKAYADDFPEGTTIEVVATIRLPE